jgi:hypothetical protein
MYKHGMLENTIYTAVNMFTSSCKYYITTYSWPLHAHVVNVP